MADFRKQTGTRGPTQGQYTKPSVQFPTPDTGEYLVVERKTVDSKEQPIAYGTAHPTLADAKLIQQSFQLEEDGMKTRLRIYAKRGNVTAQNAYNFAQQFAADSNSHRVLIRQYLLPAPVTPLAKGTADTAIPTCVLTKEEHSPRGGEDNHHIQVTRIYEELPGPWIPFTRYDEALGPVTGRRRAVVNSNQAASLSATGSLTYESRDGSNYVLWETEETWNAATNAPERVEYIYDNERGRVKRTRKVVIAAADATLTISTNLVTETSFSPFSPFLWERTVEEWHCNEHNLVSSQWDDAIQAVVTTTTTIVPATNNSPAYPAFWLDMTETPLSKVAKRRTIASLAALPLAITEYKTDQFTFPAILESLDVVDEEVGFGVVVNGITDSDRTFQTGINTVIKVAAQIRPAISVPTVHKIDTTFVLTSSNPTPDSTYTIAPNNLYHNGPLVNFNFGQVLMNAITGITATAGADDAQYAGLTETITFGASAPTRDAYLATVAANAAPTSWTIIGSEVKHYRGNISIKTNISVKLK